MPQITVPDYNRLILDSFDLRVPAQVNRSEWTGRRKVVGLPGAETWIASITIGDIATEAEEWPWRAFLLSLRGQENWFALRMACQQTDALPTVRPGANDGNSVPLSGMAAVSTILRAGQYLTIPLPSGHARNVCLTADLTTNVNGQGTALFEPALYEVPAAGASVEAQNPYVPMALATPMAGLSYSQGIAGRSFDLEEAL